MMLATLMYRVDILYTTVLIYTFNYQQSISHRFAICIPCIPISDTPVYLIFSTKLHKDSRDLGYLVRRRVLE
jgi:hypothetical protein